MEGTQDRRDLKEGEKKVPLVSQILAFILHYRLRLGLPENFRFLEGKSFSNQDPHPSHCQNYMLTFLLLAPN